MIGSTVSHYKVTSKLGEGGMGEVWRAEDTKLERDVALKMLPEAFAQDPERLARFEREARVLASLSHPNIAGIHGLEEVGGKRFLVMELVDGETLAERVQRGPMKVEEAARIAEQIAEAVEAAHEKGVVHRDLKPANVKITPDGKVKVLDFGLAKALIGDPMSGDSPNQDLSLSPTLTQAMTGMGVLLGTAGYMSPEQARGKPVDRRADIWAFGCILYEMLTGQRLFTGETATDVIGAVVHKEPDLDELSAKVPAPIRRLLERCLQKDANRRLQSIGDARIALQEWMENPEADTMAAAGAAPARWRRWLPWSVAALAAVVAVLALSGIVGMTGSADSEPVRRFRVTLTDEALHTAAGSGIALSKDGRYLAYVTSLGAERTLFLRRMDLFEGSSVVSGTNFSAPYQPFFSPDGEWLGYVTPRELKKVSVSGGAPVTLAQVELSRGASWGPDGTIVVAPTPDSGLFIVSAAGGELQPLTTLDEATGEATHRWPQFLPDGKSVLFTVSGSSTDYQSAWLEIVDVKTGKRTVVHHGGSYGRYVDTGHILYVSDRTLFALPFDVGKKKATGPQLPVLEDVAGNLVEGGAQYDVSSGGVVLAYLEGAWETEPYAIVAVDRTGRSESLISEPGVYGGPSLSPDGDRLALSVLRDDNWDVWIHDLRREVATRLTFSEGYDADPVWSPDGRWIAFASDEKGGTTIYRKRSDGSGQAELVPGAANLDSPAFPLDWSPDGQKLLAQSGAAGDLWVVTIDGSEEPAPFQVTPFGEYNGAFSPDGHWIAYESNESGRTEVYVQAFPSGGGKWQISDGGGGQPHWSGDGSELFFRTDRGVMVAAITGNDDSFQADKAKLVFEGIYLGGTDGLALPGVSFPDFDVTRDGKRFVMFPGELRGAGLSSVNLVTGWFHELK
jgi:serine/threonine-protein kinase